MPRKPKVREVLQDDRGEDLARERARAEKLARAARLYYVDQQPQRAIMKELHIADVTAVSRLLTEARDKGIVAFDIDPSFGIKGHQDPVLSRKLRDAFRLKGAMVVAVKQQQSSRGDTHDRLVDDDNLHTALANRTGLELKDRINHDDHIAVGGGRGVCQAVRFIRRQAPSRSGVRITPLCGRLWTHYWQTGGPHIERPLDADDAAFVLGLGFESEPDTQFWQVMSPLFVPDPATRMKEHCPFLPDGSWRWGEPRLALVGVGSVDPRGGHRLAEVCREGNRLGVEDPYVAGVEDRLKGAVRFVTSNHLPYFGDITNRLFPALPLPGDIGSRSLAELSRAYDGLAEKLRDLNKQMVAANWNHLRSAQSIVMTAGGAYKVEALWTVLLVNYLLFEHRRKDFQQRRIVTELCTDAPTADTLIEALRVYEESNESVREWYGAIYESIFED